MPPRPEPKIPKKRRGCFFYALILLFALPLLLVGLVLLLLLGREGAARRQLDARKEQIAAQGLPVDNESLQAYYEKLTSAKNTDAWIELLAIARDKGFVEDCRELPILGRSESEIPGRRSADEATPWETEDSVRSFLATWSELVQKTETLGLEHSQPDSRPVRFPIEFNSMETLLPDAQEMRTLARLLMLQGQTAVYDRDAETVKDSIQALNGCSRAMDGEPFLVGQLICSAVDGMSMQLLQRAIEFDVLDEEQLIALFENIYPGIDIADNWKTAWHGERGAVLPIFGSSDLAKRNLPNNVNIPFRSRDALSYLETIDGILEIPTSDLDEMKKQLVVQEDKLQARLSGSILQQMDNMLTGMLSPAINGVGESFVQRASKHRIASLAIAIRVYEKRNEKYPTSLDDLAGMQMGDTPIDLDLLKPTGGKPFGYASSAEEVVLWGFNPREMTSTPAERPVVVEGRPYSELLQSWIWLFEASDSPQTSESSGN